FRRCLSYFSEEECWNLFRFRAYDIPALVHVLGIPEYVVTENRRRYTSEEALLILMLRLRFPNRLDVVSHRMGR
ncbi:unnamed protein product, partial [Discosporangium mesarthrocarpum]